MEGPSKFQVGGGGNNFANQAQSGHQFNSSMPNRQEPQMPSQDSSSSNEKLLETMHKFMDTMTKMSLEQKERMDRMEMKSENLATYVSQMANSKSEEEAKKGTLPSNSVVNPKALHAISLRSGKEVGRKDNIVVEDKGGEEASDFGQVQEEDPMEAMGKAQPTIHKELSKQIPLTKDVKAKGKDDEASSSEVQPSLEMKDNNGNSISLKDLPFPNSYLLGKKKKDESLEKEMLDMFAKLEVNVPMLVLIKQMPSYAKFLKDLCTHKRNCRPNKKVQLGPNVSALFKSNLPVKCEDPGSFTVPCQIGNQKFGHALLDLEAAINVMPKSVFDSLGLREVKSTSVILQLADRSTRKPYGFIEDILVKVKNLVFPADFYILDMSKDSGVEEPLILGRPFMRTANTVISLKEGSITMEVGPQVVKFNVYEAMRHPFEDYSLLGLNAIDVIVEDLIEEHVLTRCMIDKCDDVLACDSCALDFCSFTFDAPFSLSLGDDVCSIKNVILDSSISTSRDLNFGFDKSNGTSVSTLSSANNCGKEKLSVFAGLVYKGIGLGEMNMLLEEGQAFAHDKNDVMAYDSSNLNQEKFKFAHDPGIERKLFSKDELVLLSRGRLAYGWEKLSEQWKGPYKVVMAHDFGMVVIEDLKNGAILKTNDHLLKHYREPP